MKHSIPHILLINPWITDFAAYNLWARPLGLLEIGGILRDAGYHISLIDCVDAENFSVTETFYPKISPFGTSNLKRVPIQKPDILASIPRRYSRYGISPKDFLSRIRSLPPPDLILVTSIMTYWYPGVRSCITLLKKQFPGIPVWLGGNYATLLPNHAQKVCRPDRVIQGPFTSHHLKEIYEILGHPDLPVSPERKGLPFWEGYRINHFLCVRTSMGCPYHCPYCASNLLFPGFVEHPIEQVADEIVREYELYGVQDFAFYDDALLMNAKDRLIPLLTRLLEQPIGVRFHTPNGVHIRFITKEIAELMKEAGFHTIRLSLEVIQPTWQAKLGQKANLRGLDRALSCLFGSGFKEDEVKVYLLVGLPGQTYHEVEQGIMEVKKRGVYPALAEYSPIPGTVLWEEACKVSPYPLKKEPLVQNNTLLPCGGGEITMDSIESLKQLAREKSGSNFSENGPMELKAPF